MPKDLPTTHATGARRANPAAHEAEAALCPEQRQRRAANTITDAAPAKGPPPVSPTRPAVPDQAPMWRERLVATVHDLKTPITIALLNLELAEMEPGIEEARKYSAVARRELEFMLDTVSSLLELEKTGAGGMGLQLAPLALGPLAEQVLARMSVLLRDKPGLRIVSQLPPDLPMVQGDADKLARVLSNLIANSITYTESGTIRISAAVETENKLLTLSVSDTGKGVQEERLSALFKLFQGDPGRKGSTGVGLAYVRRVMEEHGGSAWIETAQGRGTTVHLKFPLRPRDK